MFEVVDGADSHCLHGNNVYVPEEQYSVIQFVDAYFGIKEAIVDWYKENNIEMVDLNLE